MAKCTNKPRYMEIVDSNNRDKVFVVTKVDVDVVRLEVRLRKSDLTLFAVDLAPEESQGLRAALYNCEQVEPLPNIDYEASKKPTVVHFDAKPQPL